MILIASIVIFFLLQALFDLIVQSQMNKKDFYHSPSSAKRKAEARADDWNPPSQDCSPHPAQKQHKATTNTNQNAKKVNVIASGNPCTDEKMELSHTAISQLVLTNHKTPS